MVVINHLEWGDGELANQISLWNFPFGLTYGLTYGHYFNLLLVAPGLSLFEVWGNLRAHLRLFTGSLMGLGFGL